jgi:hypothetical protein
MSNLFLLEERLNIGRGDLLLLHIVASEKLSQDDVPALAAEYENNRERADFNLIISHLESEYPDIQFSDDVVQNCRRISSLWRFRNLSLFNEFKNILNHLNDNDIPVMLIKGAAMRYFMPNYTRIMYDVDFLVPEPRYVKAFTIAENLGFHGKGLDVPHSIDLVKGDFSIDIHRSLNLERDCSATVEKMWKRASTATLFDVKVFVPAPEDMLFIMMTNAWHNIMVQPVGHVKYSYWLFDCVRLIKKQPSINWNLLIDNAIETDTLCRIHILFQLIDKLLPCFLPQNLFEALKNYPVSDAKIRQEIRFGIFYTEKLFLIEKMKAEFNTENLTLRQTAILWIRLLRKRPWPVFVLRSLVS